MFFCVMDIVLDQQSLAICQCIDVKLSMNQQFQIIFQDTIRHSTGKRA